ncbi:MAG: ATP/GTP-binding protein, partial [Chloroflexi bacterium]|nr:ATP/GTP-binding protein [Chloroflexota bacterium]
EPVTTEAELQQPAERAVKARTTVALDFGLVRVNGTPVRLFGTPGQTRFDFMWEALAPGMDGYIVLVDSAHTDAAQETQPILAAFRRLGRKAPYLVVITKTDQPMSRPLDALIKALKLPAGVPVLTCNARDKREVRAALQEVVRYVGGAA